MYILILALPLAGTVALSKSLFLLARAPPPVKSTDPAVGQEFLYSIRCCFHINKDTYTFVSFDIYLKLTFRENVLDEKINVFYVLRQPSKYIARDQYYRHLTQSTIPKFQYSDVENN